MTADIISFPRPRAVSVEVSADSDPSTLVRDLVAQFAFSCLEEIYGRDDPRCLEAYEECATGGPALEHWKSRWLEETDDEIPFG